MPFITEEKAKQLPTHRLLAYYKSISRKDVCYDHCVCENCTYIREREAHRETIKAILDTREHVEK